jgi:hypothetical protein
VRPNLRRPFVPAPTRSDFGNGAVQQADEADGRLQHPQLIGNAFGGQGPWHGEGLCRLSASTMNLRRSTT